MFQFGHWPMGRRVRLMPSDTPQSAMGLRLAIGSIARGVKIFGVRGGWRSARRGCGGQVWR